MPKDPAFLFYSKDFYEGTRFMLPEERACYMDLLIYQHQHGVIPNDLKRVLMYCSGITEATLQATLQAKFKQTPEGWLNAKLEKIVSDRKDYTGKQSDNGIVGQFFKKAKSAVPEDQFEALKTFIYRSYTKERLLKDLKAASADFETMLKGLLQASLEASPKHLAIATAIVNGNENIGDKGGTGEKEDETLALLSAFTTRYQHVTDFAELPIEDCLQVYLYTDKCTRQVEQLVMKRKNFAEFNGDKITRVKFELIEEWAVGFNQVLISKRVEKKTLGDWCSHFINWVCTKPENYQPQEIFSNGTGNKHTYHRSGSFNSAQRRRSNATTRISADKDFDA